MTMLEEIYEAARQAAPSGTDETLLKRLCEISAAQWEARLKDGGGLPNGVCMRGGVDGGGRHLYAEERDGVEH